MTIKIPSYSVLPYSRFAFLTNIPNYIWMYALLTIVAFAIRFIWLGTFPVAITHDEVFYANQARSLSFSDSDLSGTWFASSLTSSHPLFAELPGVIMTPGFWLFADQPLLAYRFMPALLGSFVPLLMAAITWLLFKKRKLSLIVFLVASCNPWLFQVSRHGFDVLFTMFFYLSGFTLLLGLKSYWKLLSWPLFFLGFFQYQGGKVLLLPLLGLFVLYIVAKARQSAGYEKISGILSTLGVLLFSIILVVWFWLHLSSQSAVSRTGDIVLFNTTQLAEQVDERRLWILPNPLTPLFFNKGTLLLSQLSEQFVRSIDLMQFFITGEPLRNPTTVWTHGLFYAVDFFFIVLGMFWIIANPRWRLAGWLLLGWLVVGTLPQVLNTKDTWIFLRLGMVYPVLWILSSLGIYFIWKYIRPHWTVRRIVVVTYFISIAYFGYHYFMVAPVIGTTDKYFAERILASYVARIPKETKVEVLGDQSRFLFEEIAFYTKLITPTTIDSIRQTITRTDKEVFEVGNLSVSTSCYTAALGTDKVSIRDTSVADCDSENSELIVDSSGQVLGDTSDFSSSVIRSPYSGTTRFIIADDVLCKELATAVNKPLTWKTISVEQLSDEEFCQTFIVEDVQ